MAATLLLPCALLAAPPSLPGDTDCDGIVTAADLQALSAELSDGDGSNAADVDGGSIVSCVGADANGDGSVTAADLLALSRRIAGYDDSIGPVITFVGIASAGGLVTSPIGDDPVVSYQSVGGLGFRLVVEAAPGISGLPVGQHLVNPPPVPASRRPDLQMLVSNDLGDGHPAVCGEGGVPGVAPPHFGADEAIDNALSDLACRFDVAGNPAASCTLDSFGSQRFVDARTRVQFCLPVSSVESFPPGGTLITVRALDTAGNPGPPSQLLLVVGSDPLPTLTPRPTVTPMASATRTPSVTAASTGTPSAVSTSTSSPPTSTATVTQPATVTRTASASATSTPLPRDTPTGTRPATATSTRTASSTRTGTRTATRTSTITATRTRTNTPGPSPTATSTSRESPTRTRTATRTATPSLTRTPTTTGTSTRTSLASPTRTGTRTATRTQTPTGISSPTRTGTFTRTAAASPSPSRTRTGTATRTITPGPSPTRTHTRRPGTPTATPTWTRPPTRTQTPSVTSTRSLTPTRTITPTRTASGTVTRTATRSGTPTYTVTGTPPATFTRTSTRTRTPTTSPSRTLSPTITRTPSMTRTPTGTGTVTRTPTASRTGTRTATAMNTRTATATRTSTRTQTPTRTPTITLTPSITRTPSLTRTPTLTPRPGADMTYIGIARPNDEVLEPVGSTPQGWPIYERPFGWAFTLVIEAKPGPSRRPVGTNAFRHDPFNPAIRPDLEIIVSRPLGDGSTLVCDDMLPFIGGIPASPGFDGTQAISNAINDLACRFQNGDGIPGGRGSPVLACTQFEDGEFRFVNSTSTVQFCAAIAEPFGFPVGDTVVTARVRDTTGAISASLSMVVRVLP